MSSQHVIIKNKGLNMNTLRSLLCLSLCFCLCAFAEIRIDGTNAVVISVDKSFDSIAKDLALHLSLMTKNTPEQEI